jgi:hypothetical protein
VVTRIFVNDTRLFTSALVFCGSRIFNIFPPQTSFPRPRSFHRFVQWIGCTFRTNRRTVYCLETSALAGFFAALLVF